MKQKSYKQLKINEIFYNRKHNIQLTNKLRIPKIKNRKTSLNDLNIIYNTTTEIPNKNIKNLSFKRKTIKLSTNKEKSKRNDKNQIKSLRMKSNDEFKTEITSEIKDNQNDLIEELSTNNELSQKKILIYESNEVSSETNNNIINKENLAINYSIEPIKQNEGRNKNNKKKKNLTLDNGNKTNIYINKTINELDYRKLEKNCFNVKNRKGTVSFRTFLKSNNAKGNNDGFESERNYFDNRLKDKMEIYSNNKKMGSVNNETKNNYFNVSTQDFKNKNNIILINFRSDKRNILLKENKLSTSTEKNISVRNGALKILEFLKNKKNEKIILKKNEKIEERKNPEIQNNNNSKKIEEIILTKENKNLGDIKNNKIDNKKENPNNKNIFNDIINEVKEEKNYVQKVVHRKLIQGIRQLKKNNSCCNKFNKRYNTEIFTDSSIKTLINHNSVLNNIYNGKKTNDNNLLNLNIYSDMFPDRKEKYSKYLNIHLDSFKNINKSYDTYKTYNNTYENKSTDDIIIDYNKDKNENENSRVKIKKIKLDKLKNKLQNKSNSKGDNINMNLTLNNKIIDKYNNPKIYLPKKVSITKRKSLDLMPIPFFYSLSPYYKNNILTSSLHSIKGEKTNNTTYINNIKPFKEIEILDLENKTNYISRQNKNNNKIKKSISSGINNILNNENNNNLNENKDNIKSLSKSQYIRNNFKNININIKNIDNKEKVKNILYSKAKIKRKTNSPQNNNLNKGRCKTIRYVKKSKNNIQGINGKKLENSNKIMKIQEMQFIPKKKSEKILSNLDKTEPINFNSNIPFIKQNSFIKSRTYLSSEINETLLQKISKIKRIKVI